MIWVRRRDYPFTTTTDESINKNTECKLLDDVLTMIGGNSTERRSEKGKIVRNLVNRGDRFTVLRTGTDQHQIVSISPIHILEHTVFIFSSTMTAETFVFC